MWCLVNVGISDLSHWWLDQEHICLHRKMDDWPYVRIVVYNYTCQVFWIKLDWLHSSTCPFYFRLSIGTSLKNALESLVKDIFAAMSAIQTVVKSNAEESLGKIFGEDTIFNYSRILIEMMYTGELPIQYYTHYVL